MSKNNLTDLKIQNTNMVNIEDVNSIVNIIRASYPKTQKGLANQITTGNNISKSDNEKDFILCPTDFWKKLTNLSGLKIGKIYELSGLPDSGKSSAASIFMASAQKSGHYVILWDTEGKFQANRYNKFIGGDSSTLLIIDTNDVEEGTLAITYSVNAIKKQNKDAKIFIVVDSIGGMLSKQENNSEAEGMSAMPMQAAKQGKWMIKRLARLTKDYQNKETGEHSITVLCINHVYAQLMGHGYKEAGGNGLFYYASVIIQLTRKKDLIKVKNGEKIKYGIVSRAKVKKNHLFDGEECLAEVDIVVSADGISLADSVKKTAVDIIGWDGEDES